MLRKTEPIDTNKVYYVRYENAVRACKVITNYVKFENLKTTDGEIKVFASHLIELDIAGKGRTIVLQTTRECNWSWTSFILYNTPDDAINKTIGINIHEWVNSKFEEGVTKWVHFVWDGFKAIKKPMPVGCWQIYDYITSEWTYSESCSGLFVSKKACEDSNSVKIVDF